MVALDGWGRETWGSGAWGEEAPVSVSGVQSNTATGTLSTTADAVVIPNSLQLNIAEFDLTVIGDGSVVTGGEEQTVEAFLGTPVITADAPSVTTTGVEAPALVGSVTVFAGAIPLPTGIELTSNVGDVIAESENILPVTGLDLPSTLGTPVIVADAPVSVTSLSMAFADGVATTTASAVVEPNGLEINFSEGTANAPAAVILTGLNATVSLGNMRSTPWANVVTGASNTWTEVAA